MSSPLVSLENVEVHFDTNESIFDSVPLLDVGSKETVRAVDGVSFDIEENDVIALVGESGCGKTTLGKSTIGALRPTGGSVKYNGQDIWEARDAEDPDIPFDEIRRSLQMIHQDPGASLNPNRTVLDSLERPLKKWFSEMGVEEREAMILDMLERVEMTPAEDYAHRYPHQLSGGEQQRVALVRALSVNPDLILADEAVSALDVSLRVNVMDLFLEIQAEMNTSFVFISHNLSNARYLTKKAGGSIGIMYLGELVEFGPPEEVLQDPKHPYTEVLKWSTPELFADNQSAMVEQPPVRTIDVPDPINPPSGCRFHTRCPEARKECTRTTPGIEDIDDSGNHRAACFRNDPNHKYWQSTELDSDRGRSGSEQARGHSD